MRKTQISTELVRRVRVQRPERTTDYRDAKVAGFVLRARPTGVHSWRVQLPNRSWISLGRVDEVALADAREAAQACRARASLGEVTPNRKDRSDLSLRKFLDDRYEPWMQATYRGRTGQVVRVRAIFSDFLDLPLSDITAARVDRWRSNRRHRRKNGSAAAPTRVSGSTMNRDLAALQAALSRAVEWGHLAANPIKRMKRSTEDETAVVRYLSPEEEQRLRSALTARDDLRRKARRSANKWRRDRGYETWSDHADYTDHLTPLVLLALNTGLRRGELLQLRWQDALPSSGRLTVRGAGAKSGQTRHVPLNSEAVRILKQWMPADAKPQSFVFAGESEADPIKGVKKAWAGLMKKAKVPAFRFHDLRHYAASRTMPDDHLTRAVSRAFSS